MLKEEERACTITLFSLGDFKETVRNETDSLIDRLFGKSSIETRRDLQSKQTKKKYCFALM